MESKKTIVPKIKAGFSLPASLIRDLDYISQITSSSRSVVLSAIAENIARSVVLELERVAAESRKNPNVSVRVGGVAADVTDRIIAASYGDNPRSVFQVISLTEGGSGNVAK